MESWVFLGNPGVGKSTLLNCLVQRVVFRSGLNYGGGLTKDTQTCVDDARGIKYTDTPGLADGVAERAAADAITRALKTSGPRVKLCFVIRLQAGHVVGQDLVTMERVLDSIHVPNLPFGIIINGVGKAMCKKLVTNPSEVRRLVALVNSGKYTTPHLLVIPEIKELVEADNWFVPLPQGTRYNLELLPTTHVPIDSVMPIRVNDFSASVEQAKRSVLAMENDKRLLFGKQQELERKKPDYWRIAAAVLGVIGTIVQVAVGC